ncbi:MAG TPA: glycoside hydrolase domain-containing protein [Mycobacteriales bacterium]
MGVALVAAVTVTAALGSDQGSDHRAVKAEPTRLVSYHGYQAQVPTSWPVYDLSKDPTRCVRFDQHAVYLGTPGTDQRCPAHLVGRTEALLVQPLRSGSGATDPGPKSSSGELSKDLPKAQVTVTASYSQDRSLATSLVDVVDRPVTTAPPTATSTATPTATPTASGPASSASATATSTGSGTPTGSATATPSDSGAATPSGSVTPSGPATPSDSTTPSDVPASSESATPSGSDSPSVTPTATPTDTDTSAPDPSPSPTSSGEATPPDDATPSPTGTPTPTSASIKPDAIESATPTDVNVTPSASQIPITRADHFTAPSALLTSGTMGFDACTAPSLAAMSAWSSAFDSVGIYVGGPLRSCAQTNLSASWVQTVRGYGYSFIPVWVGYQAPCTTRSWTKIDPSQAAAQGSAHADQAVVDMQSLGFGIGNVVYLDVEGYTGDASCTSAVLDYVEGWTRRLHQYGYGSGVYGSAASTAHDLATVYSSADYTRPDALFFARWNNLVDVDSEPYVSNTLWASRRIKQYMGGHNETHNGVTINIDSNYLQGMIGLPGDF